jgi:Protein of unknown function (DUF4087)
MSGDRLMKALLAGCVCTVIMASAAAAETRCGWVLNPSPANWSLQDRQAEWIMATQGGEQAEGMDTLPDFTEGEWIVTNGSSYGFGCACMDVETESGDPPRITRIRSVKQLKLGKCQNDRKLPARAG